MFRFEMVIFTGCLHPAEHIFKPLRMTGIMSVDEVRGDINQLKVGLCVEINGFSVDFVLFCLKSTAIR